MKKINLIAALVLGIMNSTFAQDSLYYWRCQSFASGNQPVGILSSKIDNDTLIDIVTVYQPKGFSVSKGKGNGLFFNKVDFPLLYFPLMAKLTPVNADASVDIVALTYSKKVFPPYDQDSVFLEVQTNLNGVFSMNQKLFLYKNVASSLVRNYELVDLNNDGKKDICVLLNDQLFTLLNVNGTFALKSTYVSSAEPAGSIVVGNFDTDADKELIITTRTFITSSPYVLYGITKLEIDANFNWQNAGTQVLPDIGLILPNDYNKNNVDDLMLKSAQSLYTYSNDGSFNFTQIAQTATINDYRFCLEYVSNDNILDFLEFNSTSKTIKIYNGNTSGSFSAIPDSINLKYFSTYYSYNDLNGDGRKDLAVLHVSDGLFSIFLQNSNTTFIDYKWSTIDNYCCSDMEANDFDGDGIKDLTFLSGSVTQNSPHSTSDVYFLKGLKNGNFRDDKDLPIANTTGDYALDISLCDLNNDGDKDVICVKEGTIAIVAKDLINNYSVKLDSGFFYDENRKAYPGDFDKDGYADLLVTSRSIYPGKNLLFYGTGHYNNFIVEYTSVGDLEKFEGAFGLNDLNNDGFDDVISYYGANHLAVCYGNTSRTLTQTDLFDIDLGFILDLKVLDLNGDGHNDIVILSQGIPGPNYVTTIFNDGANNFSSHQKIYVDYCGSRFRIADMNNDSKLDIVLSNNIELRILMGLNNGELAFAKAVALDNTYLLNSGDPYQKGFVVEDFNQDGRQDIAVATFSEGLAVYYNMNANGFGQSGVTLTATKEPLTSKNADVFNISIYPNLGTGKFFVSSKRNEEISTLKIFNVEKEIMTLTNQNALEIDLTSYQSGIYYIVGYSQNNTRLFSAKIIKVE